MLLLLTSTLALATIGQASKFIVQDCSSTEKEALFVAIGTATRYLDIVLHIHDGTLPFEHSLELRQRYFGNISDADFHNVTEVFSHIQDNWGEKTFVCAQSDNAAGDFCAKNPGANAITQIDLSYIISKNGRKRFHVKADEIYLCPMVLRLYDKTGHHNDITRQATMLIHEMSHATANDRRTQDVELPNGDVGYGRYNSQQLAFWSWKLAMRNADNYTYYAIDMCLALETGIMPNAKDIERSEPDAELAAEIEEMVYETSPEGVRLSWMEDYINRYTREIEMLWRAMWMLP